jgi:hypothetical protein
LAFGIIREKFPLEKMNGALSVLAPLAPVGIGIVVVRPIVDNLGSHWLPMVATLIAALGAIFLVPESPMRTDASPCSRPSRCRARW